MEWTVCIKGKRPSFKSELSSSVNHKDIGSRTGLRLPNSKVTDVAVAGRS
jgi:hypothetical protein